MTDARNVEEVRAQVEHEQRIEHQTANQANCIARWVEANQPLDAWGVLTLERMIQEAIEEVSSVDRDTA